MKTIEYVMRTLHTNYNTPEKLKGMIEFCKKAGIRELQLVPVNLPYEPVFLPRDKIAERRKELVSIIKILNKSGIQGNIGMVRTLMQGNHFEPENCIGFKPDR